jgi:hypothetical protein
MMLRRVLIPLAGRKQDGNLILTTILFILSISSSAVVFGQSNYQTLSRIDYIVEQTDSLSNKSQRTFYLNKMDKKFDGVKETWHYTMKDGKVLVFQVRYVLDSIEFTEIYYVNKGSLIYSEEYETVYYSSTGDDEIKWGGIYYFVSSNLKQRVTLGRKKSKFENWNPELETLNRFQRRFSELQQNIPLTAKN